MKKEHIVDAMGKINDDIIEETDQVRNQKQGFRKSLWKYVAIAACFTGIAVAGVESYSRLSIPTPTPTLEPTQEPTQGPTKAPTQQPTQEPTKKPENVEGLEVLTMVRNPNDGGGWGLDLNDVQILRAENPWNELTECKTLPVFKNQKNSGDADKMRSILLDTISALGYSESDFVITDDEPDEETKKKIIEKFQVIGEEVSEHYFEPSTYIASREGIEIKVNQAMNAEIYMKQGYELPAQYHFTEIPSEEIMDQFGDYVYGLYESWFKMECPKMNLLQIGSGNHFRMKFREVSGEGIEKLLNYNFHQIDVYILDGKISRIYLYQTDISEKVGDYPLITEEEAKKLFEAKNWMADGVAFVKIPGLEDVEFIDIVYRTGDWEKYYMPYYRFVVETTSAKGTFYQMLYVPAVESKYIENMPYYGSVR